MKKTSLFILIFSLLIAKGFCQNDEGKARNMAANATNFMTAGKYDEAIPELQKAIKLDNKSLLYQYQLGNCYLQKKDYENAIKTLKPIAKHQNANEKFVQLLGSAYIQAGQADKAEDTYKDGLKKFSKSGSLYYELGMLELNRKKTTEAINYWEQGLTIEPRNPLNYYMAAKVYAYTQNKVWAVVYAEIFLNLQSEGKQSEEISQLLFNLYKACIIFKEDPKFYETNAIDAIFVKENSTGEKLSFEGTFQKAMKLSIKGFKDSLTIASLAAIRNNFIKNWKQANENNYDFCLIDWYQQLSSKGYIDVYFSWLARSGNNKEYRRWLKSNEIKYNEFKLWLAKNPIPIDNNQYCRKSGFYPNEESTTTKKK